MRKSGMDQSRVMLLAVSLLAAIGALSISNISCGSVVPNACAQSACPDVADLETRLADLEQKMQPLLAIAQLQCAEGTSLTWSGTAWACQKLFRRATISRSGSRIRYAEEGMPNQDLDLGDGLTVRGGGAGAYIHYQPGAGDVDAQLAFRIDGLRSLACTLLHRDDDFVVFGLEFATDGGNNHVNLWGTGEIATFELRREATMTYVLLNNSTYDIVCL